MSHENELCGCTLVLKTSKSTGARGDVQNFGGYQAPTAPVLTQALDRIVRLKRVPGFCKSFLRGGHFNVFKKYFL